MAYIKEQKLLGYICIYFLLLAAVAYTTPISPSEAKLFYQDTYTISAYLMHLGQRLLGGEIGFRFPFLFLGILNAYLFYSISLSRLESRKDAITSLVIYLLLPGVITSTILSSDAGIMSTSVLLVLYMYIKQYSRFIVLPLLLLMFVHWSATFVYLSMIIYAIFKRDKYLLIANLMLLLLYFFIGIPIPEESSRNYFFELLGVYAAIFSPLLFIYVFYSLYRALFRGIRDIVWAIPFLTLIMSLAFSMDERVIIVDFSPYIMIAVIVAVRTYYQSLRIRLKPFQKGYKMIFHIVTLSLVGNAIVLLLHQPIYRWIGKEYYPIVLPVYEPYDLSQKLLKEGINCIDNVKRKTYYQMRYYGIKKCS